MKVGTLRLYYNRNDDVTYRYHLEGVTTTVAPFDFCREAICMKPNLNHFIVGLAMFVMLGAAACTPRQVAAFKALDRNEQNRVINDWQYKRNHPTLRCIRAHESDTAGSYRAQNPRSTASGAYQYLNGTWRSVASQAGFPGYARAIYASPYVQDNVAFWHISHLGTSAWAGSGC